ncbi:glycoside hydrolase family 43 protein [Pseudomassariella vexata]|uniref:Glycoside hydrolase family 43 protein n=1 Tax=Pseudomassariella vexata TaxID=1141098 RepID=A0A1Y2DE61_9PEZI|nr:glycoside hydrolase family 43 protein [Pseudomassariella vexata]ORY57572.1 glycoside hydrolase family 43 protein [Pseudomassariella vexata]
MLSVGNSTFSNPILPGFHPDPSCIFVPQWDDTFFCASSSFNAFPGIPIHASKDLKNWKLIGHALNRREQLPELMETNKSTSGIWAPAIRYHEGTFYLVTTLVNDDRLANDASRWDNVIFKAKNPYHPASWSKAIHFEFEGYDTSPFWDVDGKAYVTGSHAFHVLANLDTGEVGQWITLWNGTGGPAPEGPHLYHKDGYYYLLIAEGGTGILHMVTMARSRSMNGPYEPAPSNPLLTNANTTNYFQTVGHADIFQDATGNWWGVALSTRSGPDWKYFPMGRETVMTPITWEEGQFPIFSPVNGEMGGWSFPPRNVDIDGTGPFITEGDDINFEPGSSLPAHFTHWRFPISESYTISPPGHPNVLRLGPSKLNLTALNGNYVGPAGQTFVGRRQQDTLFTYSVNLDFSPGAAEEEAGVSVFLTQNHHLDLGVVMLPANRSTAPFPGTNNTVPSDPTELIPQFRFRAESFLPVPSPAILPVPSAWVGKPLRLEIKASNMTHYALSAGPAGALSEMQTVMTVSNDLVSWGFTGTILGVYCTSNGREGTTPAYFSKWKYVPQGQFKN